MRELREICRHGVTPQTLLLAYDNSPTNHERRGRKRGGGGLRANTGEQRNVVAAEERLACTGYLKEPVLPSPHCFRILS